MWQPSASLVHLPIFPTLILAIYNKIHQRYIMMQFSGIQVLDKVICSCRHFNTIWPNNSEHIVCFFRLKYSFNLFFIYVVFINIFHLNSKIQKMIIDDQWVMLYVAPRRTCGLKWIWKRGWKMAKLKINRYGYVHIYIH